MRSTSERGQRGLPVSSDTAVPALTTRSRPGRLASSCATPSERRRWAASESGGPPSRAVGVGTESLSSRHAALQNARTECCSPGGSRSSLAASWGLPLDTSLTALRTASADSSGSTPSSERTSKPPRPTASEPGGRPRAATVRPEPCDGATWPLPPLLRPRFAGVASPAARAAFRRSRLLLPGAALALGRAAPALLLLSSSSSASSSSSSSSSSSPSSPSSV
mmetsp:Transcript_12588/g.40152  ORF Transcript_12588/g.40152 Transcript_12588/m.40152 type:complete len:222 (+) Transcript_12588:79-744(+)